MQLCKPGGLLGAEDAKENRTEKVSNLLRLAFWWEKTIKINKYHCLRS